MVCVVIALYGFKSRSSSSLDRGDVATEAVGGLKVICGGGVGSFSGDAGVGTSSRGAGLGCKPFDIVKPIV